MPLQTLEDLFRDRDPVNRVVDWLRARCEQEHGVDLSGDPLAMQRLQSAATAAVEALATEPTTEVNLPFLAVGGRGPIHFHATVTRDQLRG
jgi:molecular chaperone DnaK